MSMEIRYTVGIWLKMEASFPSVVSQDCTHLDWVGIKHFLTAQVVVYKKKVIKSLLVFSFLCVCVVPKLN